MAFGIADGEQSVGIAKTAMPVAPSMEKTPKSKYGHVYVSI
jgi:hypothetical protein